MGGRGCGLCNGNGMGEWEGIGVNMGADCVMGMALVGGRAWVWIM